MKKCAFATATWKRPVQCHLDELPKNEFCKTATRACVEVLSGAHGGQNPATINLGDPHEILQNTVPTNNLFRTESFGLVAPCKGKKYFQIELQHHAKSLLKLRYTLHTVLR